MCTERLDKHGLYEMGFRYGRSILSLTGESGPSGCVEKSGCGYPWNHFLVCICLIWADELVLCFALDERIHNWTG